MDSLERARKKAENDVARAIARVLDRDQWVFGEIVQPEEGWTEREVKEYEQTAERVLCDVVKRKWSLAESTPMLHHLWEEKAEMMDDSREVLVETILAELTDADIIEEQEIQLEYIMQDAGEDHGYRKEMERQIEKARKELDA